MKKILLLSTVLTLASFSARADITNPFYIPERGYLTDSTIAIGRTRLDASLAAPAVSGYPVLKNAHTTTVSETLTYGITGTWGVYGGLAYDRTEKNGASSFDDYDWTIGTKINTIDEAWRVQIGADVTRTHYSKWKGVSNKNQKRTNIYLLAGTETGERVFAYAKANYQDVEYGDNRGYDQFSVEGALHVNSDKGATGDAGLRFAWDTLDHVRNRDLTFFCDGYISVQKNMAIGLKADYVLASSNSIKTAYAPSNQGSYTLGFNIKYEF